MVIISVSGMSIFVVILNLYPDLFLGLFGQSGDFVNIGLSTLRVVSTAMIILCVGVIWLNAVVATGKTNIVFWIEFLGIVSYLVYVWIVIEVMKMDLEVAWMSEWIYWIMLFLPSFFYLKYGNWREDLKY